MTETVQQLADKHGVSKDAAATVLDALRRGGGRMAQFSHPEFGGMAQWSSGGMTMIGDMFNDAKKAKLNALAADLASYLESEEGSRPTEANDREAASEVTGGNTSSHWSWWPSGLGSPSSTGAQNAMRYAVFPGTRRLAVDDGGSVRIYDTGDHRISGVAQSQGRDRTLTFSGQDGLVDLSSLTQIDNQP